MNINLRPGTFSGLIAHIAGWVRGSIFRGGVAVWEVYNAATNHFILVGDGTDINSIAFDWDDMAAGAGADMVHSHASNAEGGSLDTRYLRLNASNDPVTAGLEINAATLTEPVLILQTTDDNVANPILEIQASGGGTLLSILSDGDIKTDRWLAQDSNTFIGVDVVGAGNLAHGAGSEGWLNTFVGFEAGRGCTTGWRNTAMGHTALRSITTGQQNCAIGQFALYSNTIGDYNNAMGGGGLQNNTSGSSNNAMGVATLHDNTTGSSNCAVGSNAMWKNISGFNNVAIGTTALYWNTIGYRNVAIGMFAGYRSTGNLNVFIGTQAGYGAVPGTYEHSIAIGYRAAFALTTGDNNILIGHQAGDVITTGASNIIIGYDIDPTGAAVSNELNIGALLYGALDTNRGGVNVTPPNLLASWHVDQPTADAAIPVLLLDQADVSEEMIEFVSTIGVGNAIEAVGAKVLTVTHFIKVTLPGPLTRYIPVGTIA